MFRNKTSEGSKKHIARLCLCTRILGGLQAARRRYFLLLALFCFAPTTEKTSSGPVVQCHPRALAFIANPFLTLRDSCNGLERKFYRPSNGLPIPPLLHALAPSLSRIFSRASCFFSYDCVTSFYFVSALSHYHRFS